MTARVQFNPGDPAWEIGQYLDGQMLMTPDIVRLSIEALLEEVADARRPTARYELPGTYTSEWVEETRKALGKKVRVTYAGVPDKFEVGTFVGFTTDGEFDLVEEEGEVKYGWPLGTVTLVE